MNASHAIVAEYVYDAWGNILAITDASGNDISGNATHIANLNPIRYRGYFYDVETGFYYLQSRYYDPVIGRFINEDKYIYTGTGFGGYNMYAYCNNNPVMFVDPSGSCHGYPDNPNLDSPYSGVKWGILCGSYGVHVRRSSNKTSSVEIVTSTSDHDQNRRPNTGKPGSTWTAPNGDKRIYGPDGNPEKDYDHNDHGNPNEHPHDGDGGHWHDWDGWNRGSAYDDNNLEKIIGTAGCIFGIVYLVGNDLTGCGVADDGLIAPLLGEIAIIWGR